MGRQVFGGHKGWHKEKMDDKGGQTVQERGGQNLRGGLRAEGEKKKCRSC